MFFFFFKLFNTGFQKKRRGKTFFFVFLCSQMIHSISTGSRGALKIYMLWESILCVFQLFSIHFACHTENLITHIAHIIYIRNNKHTHIVYRQVWMYIYMRVYICITFIYAIYLCIHKHVHLFYIDFFLLFYMFVIYLFLVRGSSVFWDKMSFGLSGLA